MVGVWGQGASGGLGVVGYGGGWVCGGSRGGGGLGDGWGGGSRVVGVKG